MSVIMPPRPPPDQRPQLEGADSMWALMNAIVERPKEVRAFLESWRKICKSYDEFIEAMHKYGKVTELVDLKTQTEKLLAAAKTDNETATQSLRQAERDATEIVAAAEQRAKSAESEIAARNAAITQAEGDIEKRQAALVRAEADIADLRKSAMDAADSADKDRKTAAAHLAKVRARLDDLESQWAD